MNGLREWVNEHTVERYSQICPNLGKIGVNFGQKGSFQNLTRKSETMICFQLQRLGLKQIISKF